MSTLKPVEEVVSEGSQYKDYEVVDLLTQDRTSIHTSLVAAVEGLRGNESDGYYGQALDEALTIINSIFKE